MKKLIALVCVLCLLASSIPAMASEFGWGGLQDLVDMAEGLYDDDYDYDYDYTDDSEDDVLAGLLTGAVIDIVLGDETITVHKEFKNAMDAYIMFTGEYVDYINNPDEYTLDAVHILAEFSDLMILLDALEGAEDELSVGDLAYYVYASGIILEELSTVE